MPKKILIAEDEQALAKVLQLKLKSAGYDVMVATDGEEVIKLLDSGPFDLLLLDLIMPKKDGFSVLEILKEKNLNMPIIVASNLSQQEDFNRAKTLGAKGYIIKSEMSLKEIIDRVDETLKQT